MVRQIHNVQKRYNLHLISPFQQFKHFGTQYYTARIVGKKNSNTSLALPILAALTPDYYNIRIYDEELGPLPKLLKADIVGITTLTTTANRAYDIAREYRANGSVVVMGGPHVTYMPEEGLKHTDSVVIGEAEGLWEKCLADFEKGELKEIYTSDKKIPFRKNVIPRWDLVKTSKVLSLSVQATRGCPYKCEFCLVSKMFGKRIRFREIDNVIEEIAAHPIRNFLFVDDNLTINKRYARELVNRLKPLRTTWTCQASLDVAKDQDLLKDMAEAGCRFIVLGLESVNPDSLIETKKYQNNAEEYLIAIERINKAGIQVYSSFIVGFDHDTISEFDNIYDFSCQAGIPFTMVSLLSTHKGTDLYERMKKEGRIIPVKREYSGGMFPVIQYNLISQMDLYNKYFETLNRLYSWESIRQRTMTTFSKGYFTRQYDSDQSGFFFRLKITFRLFCLYLLSPDKSKRNLFVQVLRLIKKRKLAIESAAILLVGMEGIRRHLRSLEKHTDLFRSEIQAVDKGPMKEIP